MKISFQIFLIFINLGLMAQDSVFYRSGKIVEAIVTEINPTEIKYKLFSFLSGPVYVVSKNLVLKIIYKNSSIEFFKIQTESNEPFELVEKPPQVLKKNVLYSNPFELIDGSLGLTYVRVFYRPRISVSASYAFNVNNNFSSFSNGILIEHNFNYVLSHKNKDVRIGVNYNFSTSQKSFFFVGILARFSQFDGAYKQYEFTLNKYYGYGNIGFIVRSNNGFSFLTNLALGRYKNDYIKNNPKYYMDKDYVVTKNSLINSLIITMQFGYSF